MVTQKEYDDMIKRNKEFQKARNKGKCPRCGRLCTKLDMVAVSTGIYCDSFCAYNSLVEAKDNLIQETLQFLLRRQPR